MKIRSLGYATDFMFIANDGEVISREGYYVLRSPRLPSYYWGNLLYFLEPPRPGDIERWTTLFQSEFTDLPVRHMTFAWDTITGEKGHADDFVAQGFELDETISLSTDQIVAAPHMNEKLEVRSVSVADPKVFELELSMRPESIEENEYRRFYEGRVASYQRLMDKKIGSWWGGYIGDKLVASLGLFYQGRIGRFQAVVTHPDYRRQGICARFVYETARHALATRADQLVMNADPEYIAARIYESVGFKRTERLVGLCRYPTDKS